MKYGFVYIWFDRKNRRYYVGSHWGTEDDGYICSSNWMRTTYKRRPQDFKRRIVKRVYSDRDALLIEETRYLSMIKDHELGVRYYNFNNKAWDSGGSKRWRGNHHTDEAKRKIGDRHRGKTITEEHKRAVGEATRKRQTGRSTPEETKRKIGEANRGRVMSDEARARMSQGQKGKKIVNRKSPATFSEEHRRRLSEATKKRWAAKRGEI
jgi:hypothetical protein